MRVRPERSGDIGSIRAVHIEAFHRPENAGAEPPEAGLVDALRATNAWIPELSLVANTEDGIVGHACVTRGHADEPVLVLGPIGVMVAYQGLGIGSTLVSETVRIAKGMSEALIALLGSPTYYARFGFEPSEVHRIEPPDPGWGNHFQIKLLSRRRNPIEGTFRYAPPFETSSK